MANELYSSGVRLWDKNGASASLNDGSGLLLHPETELRYVRPDVGGGISSSVNSLWFDPNAAMVSGLNGVIAGSYCPLEKTNTGAMGGDVQYANMYTGGIASATVTEIHESTGYGTLLHALSTITSVRPATGSDSATNDYIPTERAVALALAGKETTVVGGSCIVVDKEPFSTTIGVNVQTATISALPGAVNTLVPTERSVRLTVDLASGTLNASASALNNRVNALSTYVANSTVKKTDSATADSLGIVKPGKGLTMSNGGILNVSKANVVISSGGTSAYQSANALANASSVGGVVCTDRIESAGVISYKNEPIVPTVQAVWDYVEEHGGGGGAIVSQGTGITVTSDTPLTSYTVTLNQAGIDTIGGVSVPNERGLTLSNGALTLSSAPIVPSYQEAASSNTAKKYGGVIVMSALASATNSTQSAFRVVPTADAVYKGLHEIIQPYTILLKNHTDTEVVYIVSTPLAVDSEYKILSYNANSISSTILNGTEKTLYAKTTYSGSVVMSNGSAFSGAYIWRNGTDFVITNSAAPQPGDIAYQAAIRTSIRGYVTNYADNSITVALWGVEITSSYEANTDSTYCQPIAQLRTDGRGGLYVKQLYTGAVVSGGQQGGGGVPVRDGTGIAVTSDTPLTGYTISLLPASATTIGGVQVAANTGLTLNSTTGALALSKAGTTAATYGGVWVTGTEGLNVVTTDTGNSKGKLYVTPATANNIGGVKIGTGLGMSSSVAGGAADTLYVTNGGGGIQSFTVTAGRGISIPITTSSATGCKIDAFYDGPFAVVYSGTNTSTVVNISSGYVKWLDGQIPRPASNGLAMANGKYMYLCGSSGCILGTAISNATYQIVVGGKTYNRTSTTVGGKTVWSSSVDGYQLWKTTGSPVSSCWTTATITSVGDIAYQTSTPTASTSIGAITAVTNTMTTGAIVYTRDDTNTNPYSGYVWSGTSTSGGSTYTVSQFTGSAYPVNGAKTLPKVSQIFSYTTVQPSLPPAGAFYTMLAYNSGGKLYQQQYGTIWHEHWGDDYRGQFAISRSTLKQATADTAATNTYPYRYNINGGILYGSADYLKHGRLFWGTPLSGGLLLAPGDISYPIVDSSTEQGQDTLDKLKADGVITNDVTELYDGLYIPYGTGANIWLNIWSGTWPVEYGGAATDPDWWWAAAHTMCLEGILPNCYSVQLGWVTNNGAPQQDKKGSIAIRGRWA